MTDPDIIAPAPYWMPPAATPETMSDRALLAAYQRTSGEVGDAEVEALVGEIRRRGLDL